MDEIATTGHVSFPLNGLLQQCRQPGHLLNVIIDYRLKLTLLTVMLEPLSDFRGIVFSDVLF